MDILTWLIVGLVAGVLASLVMGGTGYGLVGDIIIGIAGAFVGGWVLRELGASVHVGSTSRRRIGASPTARALPDRSDMNKAAAKTL